MSDFKQLPVLQIIGRNPIWGEDDNHMQKITGIQWTARCESPFILTIQCTAEDFSEEPMKTTDEKLIEMTIEQIATNLVPSYAEAKNSQAIKEVKGLIDKANSKYNQIHDVLNRVDTNTQLLEQKQREFDDKEFRAEKSRLNFAGNMLEYGNLPEPARKGIMESLPGYRENAKYKTGDYVTYSGSLYQLIVDTENIKGDLSQQPKFYRKIIFDKKD